VPIDVAVQEPRARIVSEEPKRDIIARVTNAYDVADDGVVVVVRRVSCTADNVKAMPMQVHRVLI